MADTPPEDSREDGADERRSSEQRGQRFRPTTVEVAGLIVALASLGWDIFG